MGSIDQSPSPMSRRYVVREAKSKQELDDILEVIWIANYTPYEPFVQLFFPILGSTSAHRRDAIAESKERFWKQYQADKSIHWFYAFDTVTSKTVGCAQWVISKTNPFLGGIPKLTAPWWPEGESRRFCETILNQVYKPRASWMTRPHCGEWISVVKSQTSYSRVTIASIRFHAKSKSHNKLKTDMVLALNWMAVTPDHRLRGIGSLLMNVGIMRADDLNLECWMEASSMGKPLYEKFGFQALLKLAFDTDLPGASDEWRKCAHEMTPQPVFAMWRLSSGKSEINGGEVKLPWALGTVQ